MDKLYLSRIRLQIDSTVNYLTPLLSFANCHMVDYINKNHWENYISPDIREEVNKNGFDQAIDFFWRSKENVVNSKQKNIFNSHVINVGKINSSDESNKFPHLSNFIEKAYLHCLSEDSFCMKVDGMKSKLQKHGAEFVESLRILDFMSDKKSHEVEIMSEILASFYKWSGSSHVVDMGGGKGYLSSFLTMYYDIPVLNIDSSELNAKGAIKRNYKLEKVWSSLVKNAKDTKEGINRERRGRFHRNKHVITEKLQNEESDKSDNVSKINQNLYMHLTEYITTKTDITKLVTNKFSINDDDVKMCFTGLHTCGPLGSTIPQLFVQCPSAAVLCVVPCCYHLINERVECDSLSGFLENCHVEDSVDFPMSNYLKGFCIGRNARMLGAQSLERVVASRQLPCPSLYYRALLEDLFLRKLNKDVNSFNRLKNVSDGCNSFYDYVNKAVLKLNIDIDKSILNEQYLQEFEAQYTFQKQSLNLFHLMRMCLSPVIESLILLDRLMFLVENGFCNELGEAFLVRMFDSVLSPRCMALIAFRYNKKNNIQTPL